MSKAYNVLWIDDECEQMQDFVLSADAEGIYLVGYKSYEEGIADLETDLFLYDAVLLDARFFKSKTQLSGTEDLKGLAASMRDLIRLEQRRKLPRFIYTGQKDLSKDSTFNETYKDNFDGIFSKHSADDQDKLFAAIRSSADKQVETQIKHKYERVFEVCTQDYIGRKAAEVLLQILKCADQNQNIEPDKYITPLRKIVEDLFVAFNKHGLLPDDFAGNSVALNESSKFLSGKQAKGYTLNADSCLPEVLSKALWSILDVIQPGSHRSEVDTHIREQQTPYLLYGVTYMLLDILVWFKRYIDSKPTKGNWIAPLVQMATGHGEWQKGEITRISENGWGQCCLAGGREEVGVPPAKMSRAQLREGDQVEIKTSPGNGRTFTDDIRKFI